LRFIKWVLLVRHLLVEGQLVKGMSNRDKTGNQAGKQTKTENG